MAYPRRRRTGSAGGANRHNLDGINKLLDTKFTPEDMEYIYTNLGNGINHELCMKFVKSGYDLKVIEESV